MTGNNRSVIAIMTAMSTQAQEIEESAPETDDLGIFDVIDNHTLTCYNGVPGKGCGECPACLLRNRGRSEYLARRGKGTR